MKRIITLILASIIATTLMAQTRNSFKWLRNVEEQTVRPYSEGLSAYYENGKWGFLNLDGKIKIHPQYDEVTDFKNNISIVKKDGKYGVINNAGVQVFPISFESISQFSDGMALAQENGVKYYLYQNGKRTPLKNTYEYYPFSEGLAKIKNKKNGKWGYINTKGDFVINHVYTYAGDFSGGVAVVSKGGEYFLINDKGAKKSTSFPVDTTFKLQESGIGFVKYGNNLFRFVDNKLSVKNELYVLKHPFRENMALTKNSQGKLRYINQDGKVMLDVSKYDDAGDFSEGKAWVVKNGKFGYINTTGHLVVDTIFSYASDFKDGVAYVATGQRQGIIKIATAKDRFPVLNITNITLSDNSANGTIEVDESFLVEFDISNPGNEELRNVYISLGGNPEQAGWVKYDERKIFVGTVLPGESKSASFRGVSSTDIETGEIDIKLTGEANNLLFSTTAENKFTTKGINACKPIIEKYWVHTADHSSLTPGKKATLDLVVKNTGTDIAKDVTITLKWPEGVDFKESIITIPYINPDETKTISSEFSIKYDEAGIYDHKDFSIVAQIDEYTHKKKEVKYLAFTSGELNYEMNLVTGVSSKPVNYAQAVPESAPEISPISPATTVMLSENKAQEPSKPIAVKSELMEGLTQIKGTQSKRFALVIGNEDYNIMKRESTYQPNVEYAIQDATTFAQYAQNVMGVPSTNIILLKNATYIEMKQSLVKLETLAKRNPGELEIIVYYAGHGQVDNDSHESYLIPVDVSLTTPTFGFKLEDFYSSLSSCNAKRSIVFLDACYSGVGRGIVVKPRDTPIKGNLIVMTATSSTQRSMPYHDKGHGMFTYFLLKTLKDSQGTISIGNLFEEVHSAVETNSIWINNMEQTPELLNGPDIKAGWKEWTF